MSKNTTTLNGNLLIAIILGLLISTATSFGQFQDSLHKFSSLDIGFAHRMMKENLFRGLLHEGITIGFLYSNRSFDNEHICDWNVGLTAGILQWNGALTITADAVPFDIGYSFRYAPRLEKFKFYVGPYARLQMTWNEMMQLDAQHPYWFTQHQLGIRHWASCLVGEEKTLTLKNDLSLFSLTSRPEEWRDYATYTFNFWEIIKYMNERLKFLTAFDALRFSTRLEYQVGFGGAIPVVYFFEVTYRRCNSPAPYQDLHETLGLIIPFYQQ